MGKPDPVSELDSFQSNTLEGRNTTRSHAHLTTYLSRLLLIVYNVIGLVDGICDERGLVGPLGWNDRSIVVFGQPMR